MADCCNDKACEIEALRTRQSSTLKISARGERLKAIAALFKGGIMATLGLLVLEQAIYKILFPHVPIFEAIGLLALAANRLWA